MIAALAGLLVTRTSIGQGLATLIVWGGIILAASGAIWGGYEYIKHIGADEVRARQEKENRDAINKGIGARMSFDDCLSVGGLYDFRRQWCSGAPDSDR